MRQVSEKAVKTVANWIKNMQDGDRIVMSCGRISICNSGGELDSVDAYEK